MTAKRILSAICIGAMLISLAGCETNKESNNSSYATDTSSSTTFSSNNESSTSSEVFSSDTVTQTSSSDVNSSASQEEFFNTNNNYTIEQLDLMVSNDVNRTISALKTDYEKLKSEINNYSSYLANTDRMEEFYEKVYNSHYNLCVKLYEYSYYYANAVLSMDIPNKNKYEEIKIIYDTIYEDISEELYDEIYDGILPEMYDDYYDGILDDAYDNKEYSDYSQWLDARSDEYEWYLDTRSEIYEDFVDMRSDIYSFYVDIRSELFSDNTEKVNKKMSDLAEDIQDLRKDVTTENISISSNTD